MREPWLELPDPDLRSILGGIHPEANLPPGLGRVVVKVLKTAGKGVAWEIGSRTGGKAWEASVEAVGKVRDANDAVSVHHGIPGNYYGPTYKGPTTSCIK